MRSATRATRGGNPLRGATMTRAGAPAPQKAHRIALLFNANKVYDREIITGVG